MRTVLDVDPAVRTRGLTKRYGDTVAVADLDLEVRRGEVFGLLGPNGAGKTTTVLMLLGLTEPTAGQATVLGLDPTRAPLAVKRRVGYLPDRVGFSERRTGRENLRFTARLNRLADDEVEPRLQGLLARVGLADVADDPVGTYSRGMRQRLGIADALVKDPELLVLDEPTIAIDPEGVTELLGLIRQLARDDGKTVLLSSHLLHQVQSVCDRVGVFAAGRLRACGTVTELAERWASGTTTVEVGVDAPAERAAALLRSVPGVMVVEPAATSGRWRVVADGDPRAALSRVLVDGGVTLTSLHREGDALDELYGRWFAEVDEPAAATAGAAGEESGDG